MDDERRPQGPPSVETQPAQTSQESKGLRHTFKQAFPQIGEQQAVSFVTDQRLQPEFGGVPYTPALLNYFMNQALHPENRDNNFAAFVTDFNSLALKSQRTDLAQLPTQAFLESVAQPHLEALEQKQALEC